MIETKCLSRIHVFHYLSSSYTEQTGCILSVNTRTSSVGPTHVRRMFLLLMSCMLSSDTLLKRPRKFPLTDTRGTAVHTQNARSRPQCTLHPVATSNLMLIRSLWLPCVCCELWKWLRKCKTLFPSTKSVCRAWRMCPGVVFSTL